MQITSDQGLVSKIHKGLSKLRKETTPLEMGKILKSYFNKKYIDLQMSSKGKKRCSTSLAITEMKIKAKMRYHYIPIWMATIKTLLITSRTDDDLSTWNSHTAGGNAKLYSSSGKGFDNFS